MTGWNNNGTGDTVLMPQRWLTFHSAVAVLCLTYVWRLQDIIPLFNALQVVSLATLGALALFVVQGLYRNFERASRNRGFRIAGFILLLVIASVPGGIYMGNSLEYLIADFSKTFMLMVLIAVGVRGAANLQRFMLVNIAGAAIYCFIAARGEMSDGRLSHLIYYDANDLGMLVVCTLPFCVYFMRRGTGLLSRLIALGALPLLLLAFVRSGSRGAFLGLIAVGIFMLFRFSAISRISRILTLAAAVIAMTAVGGDQYLDLMKTLLTPTNDYNWVGNQETGRMEVWKRGVGYMLRRPVLGVGADNFYVAEGTLSERGRQQQFGRGFKWSAAHNSFVQIGAELGIPGLVAFIAMLIVAFRTGLRSSARSHDPDSLTQHALGQAFAATVIGYVVTAFFLSQAYGAFLYMIVGLIIAFDTSRVPRTATPLQVHAHLPLRPPGRGGLIRTQNLPASPTHCICRSVSVCVCGAAHRVAR